MAPESSSPDTVGAGEQSADPLSAGHAGGRVIRGGGLRVAASVAGLLAGALTAPIVVRYLGPTEFGRLAVVQSLVAIVTAIIEGGLANVAIRRYALAEPAERDRLIRNLLGLRVIGVSVGAAIGIGYALLAGFDWTLVLGTAIALLGLGVNAFQNALVTPLNADLRLGASAAVDLVRSSAAAVVQVTLVLLGASLLPFYATVGIAGACALVLTVRLVRRDVIPWPRFDSDVCGALLRETGVYAVATALGAIYFQVALQGLKLLSTPGEVGDYSVAFRVIEIGNVLPWLIAGSAFPVLAHAAEHDRERLAYVFQRSLETALLGGLGIAVMAGVGSAVAIGIIGGAEAAGSVDVLRVAAGAIPATYAVAVGGFALLALRATRSILVCNGIALLVAVVASVALVGPEGALGAAATTVIVEWFLAIAYLIALARADARLRLGWSPALRLGLLTVGAVAAGAAADALGMPALLALAVAALVFGAATFLLRLYPPEVTQALRERFGGPAT